MQVRWTREAAADLERIADYLSQHVPERAAELVRAVYDAPALAAGIPAPGPSRKEGGDARTRHFSAALPDRLHGARRRSVRRSHPARRPAMAVIPVRSARLGPDWYG